MSCNTREAECTLASLPAAGLYYIVRACDLHSLTGFPLTCLTDANRAGEEIPPY